MNLIESHLRRLTKIVCTLGPACSTKKQLLELVEKGMNVARINVSHGSREAHIETLAMIRELNEKHGCCVASLIDTRGAEIRTGDVQDPIEIAIGEEVIFAPTTLKNLSPDKKIIHVGYDGFSSDVQETNQILIDNGAMSFDIVSANDDGSVLARALQEGSISSRRHINLPGADIDLPSITEKDWDDIAFAAEHDVDFVALSFIRNADEVKEVRTLIDKKKSNLQIITKVETQKAVKNISEIIDASDGVMVARGDLGAEVPFEHLPVIQDDIVYRCRDAGKPVIVATHMLESMTEHPIPTRAEVTDVAHAATEYTDSTMLSGETASGKHPPLAVSAMDRILRATETHLSRFPPDQNMAIHGDSDARAHAAVSLARSSNAAAVVVITSTGHTARRVSKFRPAVPIITLTLTEQTQRKLQLLYGVYPLVIEFTQEEETVIRGLEAAKKGDLLSPGDRVVIISDIQTKKEPVTSIQMRTVE
jgi:pyruvate kinase